MFSCTCIRIREPRSSPQCVRVLHLRRRADLSDPINGKLGQVATIAPTLNDPTIRALVSHARQLLPLFFVVVLLLIIIIIIIRGWMGLHNSSRDEFIEGKQHTRLVSCTASCSFLLEG